MRLTEQQRKQLWRRCKAGDRQARDQLIDSYHYLAPLTVRKSVPHVPYAIEYDDLCQEANIALIRAVDQYDPTRGVTFSSYAISLMRGACLEYLRREDWVPRRVRDLTKRLDRAELKAQAEHPDRPITEAEIAAVLGWDEGRLAQRRREATAVAVVSLSAILYDRDRERGSDDFLVIDRIADPDADPFGAVFSSQTAALLRALVAYLPRREAAVLHAIYWEGANMEEVARRWSRQPNRIHQIRDQALGRLRAFIGRAETLGLG